jgi:halocyanin-like protein
MSTDRRGLTRRAALGTAVGTVAAAAAGPGIATAQEEGEGVDFDGWFDDVSNYDGVVDRRGQSEVTVEVGTEGNGGAFAFGPAAIRVDPGTTVVWEWTGEGGGHNVVSEEGTDYSYESELVSEAGFTFEHTFEQEGISKYFCVPHRSLGMKGAVVVGDQGAGPAAVGEPDYEGWFEDVSNFESTVDRRGQSEVTVEVGTEGNGGAFAFEPAAVRVDPGTTVIWEWTGEGGGHNVVSEEGTDYSYESELVSEAGFTFEHTFEQEGISKYYCTPHRSLGMKGAVVVGNVGGPPAGEGGPALASTQIALRVFAGGLAALALPVLAALGYVWINRDAYSTVEPQPAVEASGTSTTSTVREIGHDEYDPVGTAALIAAYFVILAVLWVFMYFVEFLGNGPTIIG